MSLFIISSDWRFKEKFRTYFNSAYLREFSLSSKVLPALAQTTDQPQLLIIDNKLGNESQEVFLSSLAQAGCTIPILLFVDSKPLVPPSLSVHILYKATVNYALLCSQLGELNDENVAEKKSYVPCNLIGESKQMVQLRAQLKTYAQQECTIHLYGETGTGKEIAANFLHNLCFPHRSIVPVNCSLLSSSLGDALFFGHCKGAYTDGKQELNGLIQEADKSTLFLDEIENLSLQFQTYLLRLLESGKYRRYGDTHVFTSRFRLVSASNEPLDKLVSENRMRKDFYYRITDVQLTLPPLREHPEDIPLLCSYFFSRNAPEKQLSEQQLSLLCECPWPGNVRQLFSFLKRCTIRSGKELQILFNTEDLSSGQ